MTSRSSIRLVIVLALLGMLIAPAVMRTWQHRDSASPILTQGKAPELASHEIGLTVVDSKGKSGTGVLIGSTGDDHPMWLALRNRNVIRALIGTRDVDAVRQFVSESFWGQKE